ncbi:hypothetical protein [Corynebacterium diphtheriae]|uniref:hypothetical protein n=1 Tax=Corynebacterium diphtheriae TaxID=1717 RepID=UPI000E12E2B7|nr:hypothetical protein [Corynebacterium diphtheriae]SUY93638.1 Uncharacterised protein [Corynebacterium diphtheriae bv. mitis]
MFLRMIFEKSSFFLVSITGELKGIKLVSSGVSLMVQSYYDRDSHGIAGATTTPEMTATAARDASERLNIGISLEE